MTIIYYTGLFIPRNKLIQFLTGNCLEIQYSFIFNIKNNKYFKRYPLKNDCWKMLPAVSIFFFSALQVVWLSYSLAFPQMFLKQNLLPKFGGKKILSKL